MNEMMQERETPSRNAQIVQRRVEGATLQEIASAYGITRERVRQICNAGDLNHTAKARKAQAQKRESRLARDRDKYLREVEQSDRVCVVCHTKMHPKTPGRIRTCGGECAEVWAKARYYIDAEQWERHRMSVARSIINHASKRTESEIAWATKIVAGEAPEPRGRWTVSGSEVERLVTEVLPRLRGRA